MITDAERADYRFTARQDLLAYKRAMTEIYAHDKRIRELRDRINSLGLTAHIGEQIGRGEAVSKSELIAVLADACQDNRDRQVEAVRICQRLERRVAAFTRGEERAVLLGVYLQGLKLNRIAAELHYSRQHLWRIHGKALETYGKKLMAEEKR